MENYKILEKLLLNLRVSYIFYIPKDLLPKEELEKLHPDLVKDIFDQIIGLDKEGTPNPNYKLYILDIMDKRSLLKQNTMALLEAKVKMDEASLNYILEEYKKHLDGHLHISNWLNTHLQKYFPKEYPEVHSLFLHHNNSFIDHSKELVTLFNLEINTPLKNDPVKEFKNLFLNEKSAENVVNQSTISTVEKWLIKPVKEITDDEIDHMLLNQVFGLDPKYF